MTEVLHALLWYQVEMKGYYISTYLLVYPPSPTIGIYDSQNVCGLSIQEAFAIRMLVTLLDILY